MMRRKAKSQRIGPLLPSLIVARCHAWFGTWATSSCTVGSQPLERQTVPFHGNLQQFQPNFGLGLKGQIFGYAARLSEIGVRFFEPFLRHKHLAVDQAVSETADVPQMNAQLRVGHLAHRTTVLRSDPDRIPTLFESPFHWICVGEQYHDFLAIQLTEARPCAVILKSADPTVKTLSNDA